MNKETFLAQLIGTLEEDYALYLRAAKSAHAAATHEENIPDNKYDTLALEASYVAQGQANRAQEIRGAILHLKRLAIRTFQEDEPIRLTALVELEAGDGSRRMVFLSPVAGGLSIRHESRNIRVVTPESPLGRTLLGCQVGDLVSLAGDAREYEIISVI